MEILNIIQCGNLGGMEKTTLRLLKGLKDRGQTVFLLSISPIGMLKGKLDEAGWGYSGVPYQGRYGWKSHFLLRREIRSHRHDALIMTGHNVSAFLALPSRWQG